MKGMIRMMISLGLVVALTSACQTRQIDRMEAPVGSAVAVVEEPWSPDPPNQRLVLKRRGDRIELLRLAPDSEACEEIAWSEDGERLGFLVTGARLILFEVEPAEMVADLVLLSREEREEGFRPRRIRLREGGFQVVFDLCPRDGSASCRERSLSLGS